jgi:hypothetical protein
MPIAMLLGTPLEDLVSHPLNWKAGWEYLAY